MVDKQNILFGDSKNHIMYKVQNLLSYIVKQNILTYIPTLNVLELKRKIKSVYLWKNIYI